MTNDIHTPVWTQVRTTFVRGAVLIIPLALTVWFFRALLNAIDGIFSPVLEAWLGREVPGLGFLSMVVIILLVGLLSRNLVGRIMFSWFENLVRSIPFVRSVYGAIRDLVNASDALDRRRAIVCGNATSSDGVHHSPTGHACAGIALRCSGTDPIERDGGRPLGRTTAR